MKFLQVFPVFTSLVAVGFTSPSARAATPAADRPVVVLLSIDGLAGYYLDDPKAEMSTLRALAADGARASLMKASNPTVTWTNHATLVTGDRPAKHGVAGNTIYDRDAHRRIVLISDPELDGSQILKVPTIYDIAKQAGLKTIGLRWPLTRGAKGLDECIPDMTDDQNILPFCTPDLVSRGRAAGIFTAADFQPDLDEKHPQIKDEAITRLAEMVLRDDHPDLLLVHLINVDHTEHMSGPKSPAAYAAVKEADGFTKRIRDALNAAAPGRGTLIVVSDHGFSAIQHQILPNRILRDAGLEKIVGVRVVAGDVVTISEGGADFVYVTNPADPTKTIAKVQQAFAKTKGIEKILTAADFPAYGIADPKVDPHAPDLVLMADEGYVFGDTSGGAIPEKAKPEHAGSHGHDANFPDLHATFIADGADIKKGVNLGEIENIDVAPTIATLLGLTMPDVDGKPLTAALVR